MHHKKKSCAVAQGVGPQFKPQYHKKKKKERKKENSLHSYLIQTKMSFFFFENRRVKQVLLGVGTNGRGRI
jgi:hypothetical protein